MDPLTIGLLAGGSALVSGVSNWFNRKAKKDAAEASADAANEYAGIVNNQIAKTNANLTASFDEYASLMNPYATAGTDALSAQQDLMGLNGTDAQQAAVSAISESPQLQAMIASGENSILQNASATGGLRGGDTQSVLAQYSPSMINDAINQQYANLSGLSSQGMSASSAIGSAGMNLASQIGQNNIYGAGLTGDTAAADALLAGQPSGGENFGASLLSGIGSGLGTLTGLL